jgi:hypothetical protein
MEFAALGDCIHILTEVTSHLKDGQVFKVLDFGHTGYSLVSGFSRLASSNERPMVERRFSGYSTIVLK